MRMTTNQPYTSTLPASVTYTTSSPVPPVPTPPTQPEPKPEPPKAEPKADERAFPENTPVAEMTDKQAAAYWKFYARKHEDAARDVPDLKAKAAAWEKYQSDNATDAEKAISRARAEGEAAATDKALTRAAITILKAGLQARGRDETAVNDLIAAANPAAFIHDGDIDTDRVARYVDQIAGPVTGVRPDMGQGRRTTLPSSGVNVGRDLWNSTNSKPTA